MANLDSVMNEVLGKIQSGPDEEPIKFKEFDAKHTEGRFPKWIWKNRKTDKSIVIDIPGNLLDSLKSYDSIRKQESDWKAFFKSKVLPQFQSTFGVSPDPETFAVVNFKLLTGEEGGDKLGSLDSKYPDLRISAGQGFWEVELPFPKEVEPVTPGLQEISSVMDAAAGSEDVI